jgi:hypothetical protein
MLALLAAPLFLALAQMPPTPPTPALVPPAGWQGEHLVFPLGFAPELALEGSEDLAFAPGMFDPESDSYFSYALALTLTGEVVVDVAFLDHFLETYYRGLCRAVGAERGLELDLDSVRADVRRAGDGFVATVACFDAFTSGGPLELTLEIEAHATPSTTEVLGLASPLDAEAPVWAELHALRERWRATRPAALTLNHVYFVVDPATYAALVACEPLRRFALCEQRETVRAEASYEGFYVYGRRSYFEFLPAGAAGNPEGSTGLAFGLEREGASAAFAARLAKEELRTFPGPVTRAGPSGQVPWFRILGLEVPRGPLSVFSMEYEGEFLTRWHAELAPAQGGGASRARGDVLARYAAVLGAREPHAAQPFAEVRTVRLALAADQRERLGRYCAIAGYTREEQGGASVLRGPGVELVLEAAAEPGGITALELELTRPFEHPPLALGALELRFDGLRASLVRSNTPR